MKCVARFAHRFISATFLTLLVLSSNTFLWSWGPFGHRLTAQMTESLLNPKAHATVQALLGPGISMGDVATWADTQKEIPGTETWHYVDVPITEPAYSSKFCIPAGCVVGKITDFNRVLADPGASWTEKQQALKFLLHFIEDLHCPLHVGDAGNRGGNEILVRFFKKSTELHEVWDTLIIERHSDSAQEWISELREMATPENVAEWSKGTVEDWATESLIAAKAAYCLPHSSEVITSGTRLGKRYFRASLPTVQKQLAKAAVRTASTLNDILGDGR